MKKLIVSVILSVLSAGTFTACGALGGGDEESAAAVVLVIGNHANANTPNLSTPEIVENVKAATESFGYASIILLDGSPSVVGSGEFKKEKDGLDAVKYEREALAQARSVLDKAAKAKAATPEFDTLKALELARRSFPSTGKSYEKHIVIMDSGLSTAGVLNFSKYDFISADALSVTEYLAQNLSIPDLSGITVTWIGLGDVASPQPELTGTQREQLRGIWQSVISTGGGTVEFLDTLQSAPADPTRYPKVTIVNLNALPAPDLPKPTPAPTATPAVVAPEPVIYIEEPIVFTEEAVRFNPNVATYANQTAAEETLKPVAEFMLENPGFNALLIGTTAGAVNNDFSINLSYDRANAVKATLTKFGVPSERITVIGLGSGDTWHIDDTDANGNMNEETAKQNRKVVLIDAESDTARGVMPN